MGCTRSRKFQCLTSSPRPGDVSHYQKCTMIRFATTSICILTMLVLIGCGLHTHGDSDVDTAMRLYEQRNFAAAIPHLKKAIDKPLGVYTRSEVLTTIGNCYNELEQYNYTTAVKHLERAVELDDSLAVAHSNLAMAYAPRGGSTRPRSN